MKGLFPILVRSSPARLPKHRARERQQGTIRVSVARRGPFCHSCHKGQLEPPMSTPSLHLPLPLEMPGPLTASLPLALLCSLPWAAPSAYPLSGSPSPLCTSSRCPCCDSLMLRRHQSEWKKPNQTSGYAALYIFYSDSQA